MHITTFGRSLVVLRTLLITQPQTAWMPAEFQTAMDGWKPVKKEKLFEVLDRAAEKPCHKDSDKACRRYGDTSATGVRD